MQTEHSAPEWNARALAFALFTAVWCLFPSFSLPGVVIAVAYLRSSTLWVPIVAHVLHNFIFSDLCGLPRWSDGGNMLTATTILGVLVALMLFPLLLRLARRAAMGILLMALICYLILPALVYLVWGEPTATQFWLGWSLMTLLLGGIELLKPGPAHSGRTKD
jgi:hypothetical protein